MRTPSWSIRSLIAAGLLIGGIGGALVPAEAEAGHRYVTVNGMVYNPEGGSWQDRVWIEPD